MTGASSLELGRMRAFAPEQDRFGLNLLASIGTFRPKREFCSIQWLKSKIHVPRSKPSASIRNVSALALAAAEGTFREPMWKGKRLDLCYTWSKNCGQPVADAFCLSEGYQKALSFEQEPARPTQLIAQRRVCTGDVCQGFKFITCFTAGKRGPRRDGPTMID